MMMPAAKRRRRRRADSGEPPRRFGRTAAIMVLLLLFLFSAADACPLFHHHHHHLSFQNVLEQHNQQIINNVTQQRQQQQQQQQQRRRPATTTRTIQHNNNETRIDPYDNAAAQFHRRLPADFQACGTADPNELEKIEMGLAHAVWEHEYDDETTERRRRLNKKNKRNKKRRKKKRRAKKKAAQDKRDEQIAQKFLKAIVGGNTGNHFKKNPNNGNNNQGNNNNNNRQTGGFQQRIHIPVWFTVFQKRDGTGTVQRRMIDDMVQTLNKAFYESPFRFHLKGVQRRFNLNWFKCENQDVYKKQTRRGGKDTMNVWLCDTVRYLKIGGNAYLPPIVNSEAYKHLDGINLMNPALGGADYAKQALVHEAGHFLGLLHTFQDECDVHKDRHANYPSYYFSGDGVKDTPAHAEPTIYETAQSHCWRRDQLNTCKNKLSDQGRDPIDNYMNYLPGECYEQYGRFTNGQIRRMVAEYKLFRTTTN